MFFMNYKVFNEIYIDILIFSYIYMMILLMMIYVYKFMLVVLMIIEFMIVNISYMMYLMFSLYNMECLFIYYLIFSVCEGVLGLSLLVMIVRFNGNELYYLFNMIKF